MAGWEERAWPKPGPSQLNGFRQVGIRGVNGDAISSRQTAVVAPWPLVNLIPRAWKVENPKMAFSERRVHHHKVWKKPLVFKPAIFPNPELRFSSPVWLFRPTRHRFPRCCCSCSCLHASGSPMCRSSLPTRRRRWTVSSPAPSASPSLSTSITKDPREWCLLSCFQISDLTSVHIWLQVPISPSSRVSAVDLIELVHATRLSVCLWSYIFPF